MLAEHLLASVRPHEGPGCPFLSGLLPLLSDLTCQGNEEASRQVLNASHVELLWAPSWALPQGDAWQWGRGNKHNLPKCK